MINVFAYGKEVSDFGELINAFPTSEFDSPVRSTVALLDYWRALDAAFDSFSSLTGTAYAPGSTLHFEYRVPVVAGRGKPSHTDLMILDNRSCCAIEAKFTEPPYEKTSSWLGTPAQPNRKAVLGGWLALIAQGTGIELGAEDVADIPYQLVHRTASACEPRAAKRKVIYQIFDPSRRDYYLSQLRIMRKLLRRQTTLQFGLLSCQCRPTPEFLPLFNAWNRGSRKLSREVIHHLSVRHVFEFGQPTYEEVA